jgi:DNA mismatch endonuclease, patch repair protein
MDNLTRKQRHLCMSRIRSKNTRPEIAVRNILRGLKQRYRTHVGKLPGNPDIVIPKKRVVIFINGCFWHQHKGCKRKAMPKVNLQYWKNKLKNNVQRQKYDIKALRKDGWKVAIVWECEAKNSIKLARRIKKVLVS